jgi:hypothetical protein
MKTRCLLAVLLVLAPAAHAIEVRVTAPALERTLERHVFHQAGPDGKLDRHYLRGSAAKGGCSIYSDEPHVMFKDDRVYVTVKTHAKLGFGRNCFGISVSAESEVSFIPEAQGESVGFRDARIEHLSSNKEVDLLLEPFLQKKLPQEMTVNAADLIRKLLVRSPDSTDYLFTLEMLQLHSLRVDGQDLVVDLDANFRVE